MDLTTVASSGVVAAIICVFQLLASRYTNKFLDRIEKTVKKERNRDNCAECPYNDKNIKK